MLQKNNFCYHKCVAISWFKAAPGWWNTETHHSVSAPCLKCGMSYRDHQGEFWSVDYLDLIWSLSSKSLSCKKFHRSLEPTSCFTSWSKVIFFCHTKLLKLLFGCNSEMPRAVTLSICYLLLAAFETWTSASYWKPGIDQIWLLMKVQRKMRQPPSSTDKEKSGFFPSTY